MTQLTGRGKPTVTRVSFLKGEQHAVLTLDVLVEVFSMRLLCWKKNANPSANEPGTWLGLCALSASGPWRSLREYSLQWVCQPGLLL